MFRSLPPGSTIITRDYFGNIVQKTTDNGFMQQTAYYYPRRDLHDDRVATVTKTDRFMTTTTYHYAGDSYTTEIIPPAYPANRRSPQQYSFSRSQSYYPPSPPPLPSPTKTVSTSPKQSSALISSLQNFFSRLSLSSLSLAPVNDNKSEAKEVQHKLR